ncbi:peroxiredoxin [Methylomicrobium lacus]|uniref:peroxiredoxin n=1 Tax=Methylomicrobium lacus TaxID=136992 RepID=UPI00045E978E|nr:peroxiredoxin [Methylomicrobium lacus]
MKRLFLKVLLSHLIALPALAVLPEGHPAPAVEAQASLAGKALNYSLQETLKKSPVVVYFYPSAYTGGCNIQAHTFAVDHDKFAAAGASIVGVSLDSIDRLNDFSADPEYCAGKFPVVADADGKIAKAFDVAVRAAAPGKTDTRGAEINHGFAERATFIITPDGKIAANIGGLKPKENVAKALEIVQQLKAGQKAI